MKIDLKIPVKDLAYSITIGENLFPKIWEYLNKNFKNRKVIIFCDSTVEKLYAKKLQSTDKFSFTSKIISFPAGEKNKSTRVKEMIETKILKSGFDRKSIMIALGGGVTGDLGGFISATYYRGIPFIQVPTTLLAMVDSSVGGKVAVNHTAGKNLIGAFYQPAAVFIDLKTLSTLPQNQFLNGLGEVIKTALIIDKAFFQYLVNNREKILKRDIKSLTSIIYRSCSIKAKVVMKDEKESGFRKILNYGHTIGHAIESASQYKINHGFAIAIGINLENRIAYNAGILGYDDLITINNFLNLCGFNVDLPEKYSENQIISKFKYDKKSVSGVPRFVLLKEIGKSVYDVTIDKNLIIKSLF
jgi:3-dehydroquinate synthase